MPSTTSDPLLTIRPASVADATAMQALYAEAILAADWLPEEARPSPRFADVSIDETVHVAVRDADVVGLVSVQVADAFIHHLYVAPQARGSGVGQHLLASLESWLPKPWRLKCVSRNTRALAFYAKAGWRAVGLGESDDGAHVVLACG